MGYINRTLESSILEINKDYSCLLLIGPRQVGKTTMLEHLMKGTNRTKVSLDDVEERRLAKSELELFLQMHPAMILPKQSLQPKREQVSFSRNSTS